jgi:hypothetical protein
VCVCVTVLTRNCIPSFPFYQRNHINIAVMSLKEGQVKFNTEAR